MRRIFIALALIAATWTAHAGCSKYEIRPDNSVNAKYIGELAGVAGRHRCKDEKIVQAVSGTAFQAKCQPNGTKKWVTVGRTGYLSGLIYALHSNCSVNPGNYNTWYVEGTAYKNQGGYYNQSRRLLKIWLSNGATVKVWL